MKRHCWANETLRQRCHFEVEMAEKGLINQSKTEISRTTGGCHRHTKARLRHDDMDPECDVTKV